MSDDLVASMKGKLLVATPPLVDENFDRTVVLLLEHNVEGALGVVLNRPSEHLVADALSAWTGLATPPAVLFGGGPVEPEAVIGLARSRGTGGGAGDFEHWAPVLPELGTVDLTVDPDEVEPALEAVRLFTGYSGWGPGQLEGELDAGAWIVANFDVADAFADAPADLWRAVLRRQGGRLAWLANFPDDVSEN